MRHLSQRVAVFSTFAALASSTFAASTVQLPAWVCTHPDSIFASAFNGGEVVVPHAASAGTGGTHPGDITRSIAVSGVGTRTFYLHVPPAYAPSRPMPMILVLHGASGSAADSPLAAQDTRSDWSGWADANGFIVLAAVGSQAQGGWSPSTDVPAMQAAINDTAARYNIEWTRLYLWGFSAGAHLAHDLGLNNTDYFAAYGVSAGALTQFACTDDGSYPPLCNTLLGGDTRKIPVDIHLGFFDPLYSLPYDAQHDPNRFTNNGWTAGQNMFYTTFADGHTYTVDQLGEIWTNICPNAVIP